jgi:superfamily II DNA or RNA helicase
MTIHLRQYQQEALEAEARHRAEHPDETRLAIVLPTGAGKTITFAERAKRHVEAAYNDVAEGSDIPPWGRVLILVHTDELAQQAEAKVRLVTYGRASVGVVKAERDEVDADIVIGSVQTLANPARRARITDVGLVIVDECHHATADSYQAIMRHFGCMDWHERNNEQVKALTDGIGWKNLTPALGFTATLERGDGQGLGEIWQDVAYSRDVAWGVRKGYLVQPVGHRLEIELPITDTTGRRFETDAGQQDRQLVEALAPEKIVEKWVELAKGRPTVAFMPLVRSARALRDAFMERGVTAAVISGDMPSGLRRLALTAYELGETQVLVNAMVLTEGWDSPRTSCVIVGRPTKSRSLFVQMAGRGLRPVPGIPVEDQDCILITVADATTDLCSIADLSDRPLDRTADGPLTAMEDAWDLGKALDEANLAKLWTGHVDAKAFDPIVQRSSKVWRATEHGTPFLPISKDGEYVFVVGTSVWMREQWRKDGTQGPTGVVKRLHKDLPDLELAMTLAEQEAEDRGGDLGRLLADRNRPWRKLKPSVEMINYAMHLGLGPQVDRILTARAGGKAGKISDLIARVQATRALEPMVKRIKEATDAPVDR